MHYNHELTSLGGHVTLLMWNMAEIAREDSRRVKTRVVRQDSHNVQSPGI